MELIMSYEMGVTETRRRWRSAEQAKEVLRSRSVLASD